MNAQFSETLIVRSASFPFLFNLFFGVFFFFFFFFSSYFFFFSSKRSWLNHGPAMNILSFQCWSNVRTRYIAFDRFVSFSFFFLPSFLSFSLSSFSKGMRTIEAYITC